MKNLFIGLIVVLVFGLTAFVMQTHSDNRKEIDYITPDGAKFQYPKSWQLTSEGNITKLVGPEGDFIVYVLTQEKAIDNKAAALALWRTMAPGFPYPVFEAIQLSTDPGWDAVDEILFDVSEKAKKIYKAYPHTIKDKTHWILLDASIAAYSRRGADFSIILNTFRTKDMKELFYGNNPAKPFTPEKQQEFAEFIRSGMAKEKIPGGAFAVIDKTGTVIFELAVGVKDITTNEPVSIETPFMIGSVTKALTTLMMARLVDDGKITWNTKIKDLMPGFKTGSNELTENLDIKTSVSASMGMPQRDSEFIFKYQGITSTDRIAELATMIPTTKIGETFQYSNHLVLAGGYAAASAYAPEVSLEEAFERAMNDMVFAPLNMKNTSIKKYDATSKRGAFPHVRSLHNEVERLPIEREESLYSTAPAGAGSSTVKDLLHYVELELNDGVFRGKRLVSKEALHKRRVLGPKISDSIYYGLGLIIEDFYGIKIIGHGGNNVGFSAGLNFFPDHGFGLVALTNMRFANDFLAAVLAKFMELTFDLPNRSQGKLTRTLKTMEDVRKGLRDRIDTKPDAVAWIDALIGDYDNPSLGSITIRKSLDGLGYELDCGEWKGKLGSIRSATGEKTMIITSPPFHLEFRPSDGGAALIMSIGQQEYIFKRS